MWLIKNTRNYGLGNIIVQVRAYFKYGTSGSLAHAFILQLS